MTTTNFKDRFMAVKAHFLAMGLTTRIHKRTKCLPRNALSFVEVQNLVRFLNNYAETHAILLPGRIPGYKTREMIFSCYQLVPPKKLVLDMSYTSILINSPNCNVHTRP